jgi:hypothetical protein
VDLLVVLLGICGALGTSAATAIVWVVLVRQIAAQRARQRSKLTPEESRRQVLGVAIGSAGGLVLGAALILAAEGVWRTPLLLGLLAVGLTYMLGMAFALPIRQLRKARQRRA